MTNQHELDMLRDQAIYLDQTLEKARELEAALGNIGKAVRSLGLTDLSENLEAVVEIAGSLGGKLDDIGLLNKNVPSPDELEECAEAAGSLAGRLDDIGLLNKNVPSSDELEECAEAATGLCKALESVNAEAERLPSLDN